MSSVRLFYDFHYFYAAAKLYLNRASPYDPVVFENAVRLTGWPINEAVQTITHIPWSLPLFGPISIFDFDTASGLWLALNIFLAALSLDLIYESMDRRISKLKLACLLAVFPPAYSTILNGQINFALLAGLLIFERNRGRSSVKAGVGLALTALKPHLFIPFYVWVAATSLLSRNFAAPIVAAILLGAASFLVELTVPGIWRDFYAASIGNANLNLSLPGASLSQIAGNLIQFRGVWLAGSAAFSVYAIWMALKRREDLGTILALSLIAAPYMWAHSLLVLAKQYLDWLSRMESENQAIFAALLLGIVGLFDFIRPLDYPLVLCWLPLAALTIEIFRRRGAPNGAQN